MKKIFYSNTERGGGEYGWLSTRYSFSFNTWYDQSKMGFGTLRVLNDDVIAPGQGFGMHGHRDMEIITIVMRGSLVHQDSMGNVYIVREGDVQVMSAGTGVMHSERNASTNETLELFQIWVEPKELSVEPRYAQKNYDFKSTIHSAIELVGADSLLINQDAFITYASYHEGEVCTYNLHSKNHGVYIFVVEGDLLVEGEILEKRDAVGLYEVDTITILSKSNSKFLVLEVSMN